MADSSPTARTRSLRRPRSPRWGSPSWGSVAGLIAAGAYVAGDILMLGAKVDARAHPVLQRPDVDERIGAMLPFSATRLRAGALLGVLASPLYLAGTWDQYRKLKNGRADARRASLVAAILAGCAHTVAPYIHGMFYPYGEAFKRADEAVRAGADSAEVDRLVAHGMEVKQAIEVPYVAYAAALLGASALMSRQILRGRSAYPRWSALVVPPALPIGVLTALTASHKLPHPKAHVLQGAGISLGLAVSYAASALVANRKDKTGYPRAVEPFEGS